MEKEITIDLFDAALPDNESFARLLDDGRWQELISKVGKEPPRVLSPEEWKAFVAKQEGSRTMDESQWKQFIAEQDGEPSVDPLGSLIKELIEGP